MAKRIACKILSLYYLNYKRNCYYMVGLEQIIFEKGPLTLKMRAHLTINKCVSADWAVAGSSDEYTSPPSSLNDTHKHTLYHPFCYWNEKKERVERRRTVKACCPECAHTCIRKCTHTILMHARPPSINKWHQMLSANSLCKRERALRYVSAVSSQGWQLHKKAWNNLPAFLFSSGSFTKQIKRRTLDVGMKK